MITPAPPFARWSVLATFSCCSWVLSCSDDPNRLNPADGQGGAPPTSSASLVQRPDEADETIYSWDLPPGFPQPWEPRQNLTTKEKVELGRHLFYDERLSKNQTQSCASCHRQELAFTDGLALAVGSTGERHPRSSMSLTNVGYASSLTWGNPLLVELERQVLLPLFGETPVELGFSQKEELTNRLAAEPRYEALFVAAFGNDDDIFTLEQVTQSLAAFQRTLISGRSAYDRWAYDDDDALNEQELRGFRLFFSERFECFHCHGGFNFTDHTHYANRSFFEAPYHNTGLYNLSGTGDYPEPNWGVAAITLEERHMGQHKAPTLRNIAVTAPYMHDGSVESLEAVLEHYAAGGRTVTEGPRAGVGADNPYQDGLIRPIEMSEEERDDLIAFLETLTDEAFLNDPRFSSPW